MDNQRVTNRLVKDALLHCKRRPFTHQKMRVCQNVHILFFMHKAPTFSSQGFAIS